MKYIFIISLVFFKSYSQSPAGVWYFGNKAGINFNGSNDPVALSDGELETFEGCATLSDNAGNLLFYTDGIKVWNRNHLVMPNGDGLFGDPSSTQSGVIVPKPNSPNLFYVFTVDELAKPNGLNYSLIDLSLDNGNGDIILKNINLATPCLEKITVVKHSNGINFWVIAHKYNSNQFLAYEITPTNILPSINSNVGIVINGNIQRTLGYMKSSPNGKYVACAHSGIQSTLQLFNFNNTNGELSLLSTSSMDTDNIGAYGLEFSSNSKLLYVSNIKYSESKSEIIQFDIESENEVQINNSKTVIASYTHNTLSEGILSGLQLGPNQKIYVSRNNYPFLGSINSPNSIGTNCQFVLNSVNLNGRKGTYGLPTFITSYLDQNFISSNFCFGDNTNFKIPTINNITSAVWNFGDFASTNNTSINLEPTHVFSSSGNFNVNLTINVSSSPIPIIFNKVIYIIPIPIANTPTTFEKCEALDNEKAIFNLLEKNLEILGTQSPNDYNIKYYSSLINAQNNTDPLTSNYENTTNPQIVYARIQAKNAIDCYATTSFEIKVIENPIIEKDTTIYYCLNTYPEKITLNSGQVLPIENYTYSWSTNENTENIKVNQAGVYTVEIKNSSGCLKTRTITVINSEIGFLNYTESEKNGITTVNALISGVGNYVYTLNDINGLYQSNSLFRNVKAGFNTIYAKDLNGCGISQISFSIIGYPQFFTPNNDSVNDTWGLYDNNLDFKSIYIFDRFGKLIKELTKTNSKWDGNFLNKKMPSSDYWFKITLDNGKVKNGHFTLKR